MSSSSDVADNGSDASADGRSLGQIWFNWVDNKTTQPDQQNFTLNDAAAADADARNNCNSRPGDATENRRQQQQQKDDQDEEDRCDPLLEDREDSFGSFNMNNQMSSLSSNSDMEEQDCGGGQDCEQQQEPIVRLTEAKMTKATKKKKPVRTESSNNKNTASGNDDGRGQDNHNERARKRRKLSEQMRKERNMREQERSNRLSDQFTELRNLLVAAGIVVPKGTKGSVLSLVVEYVKMLQEANSKRSAACQQLQEQVFTIGCGAQGPEAAQTIRAVAAKNGLPSFGSETTAAPITSSSNCATSSMNVNCQVTPAQVEEEMFAQATHMTRSHYQTAFDHCLFPMAIASLGGSFLECNRLFWKMTQQSSKDQLRSSSIFNFTVKDQLPYAFDCLNNLLTTQVSSNITTASSPASSTKRTPPIDLLATIPDHVLRIHLVDNKHHHHIHDDESCASPLSNKVDGIRPQKFLLVTLVPNTRTSSSSSSSSIMTSNMQCNNFTLPSLQYVDQQQQQQRQPDGSPITTINIDKADVIESTLNNGSPFFALG